MRQDAENKEDWDDERLLARIGSTSRGPPPMSKSLRQRADEKIRRQII